MNGNLLENFKLQLLADGTSHALELGKECWCCSSGVSGTLCTYLDKIDSSFLSLDIWDMVCL